MKQPLSILNSPGGMRTTQHLINDSMIIPTVSEHRMTYKEGATYHTLGCSCRLCFVSETALFYNSRSIWASTWTCTDSMSASGFFLHQRWIPVHYLGPTSQRMLIQRAPLCWVLTPPHPPNQQNNKINKNVGPVSRVYPTSWSAMM